MKIFELLIDEDDELSGTALLSLVKDPATNISWEIFGNEPHDCSLHEQDFSTEDLSVLEQFGEELTPEMLKGATIKPVDLVMNEHGFVSVPPISSNPRVFDLASGDGYENDSITRYIYVVDTSLGSPLIPTSRPLCRKMIMANKVFSRSDINRLSQALTSAGDSFKLVYRKNTYPSVDFWQYKSGKFCRHRWFQLEFLLNQGETFDEGLRSIPVKADQARGRAIQIGGGASRPFQSEWSILPPGKTQQMSSNKSTDPIAFHMGVFIYPSRFAALIAEPMAKKLTKVKVCMYQDECMTGWAPIEITPEYYEETAEVLEYFEVRQTFAKIPDYMREAAKRAVDYAEENGWGDCGTDVGKRRANDLADGSYTPSMDILSRMYSYGSRHKVDYESSKSIEDGCGYLMMLSWGFTPDNYEAAMKFLERELEKSTELNVMMSSNEYEGDITSVVFQPNQKIYRWDRETNQPYYVFMSRETIRKMLMKFQRTRVGKGGVVNLEHSGYIFDPKDVYTYENWLVGEDPEKDKSYQIFGRTFEPGTWITTIHFRDKRVFEDFVLSNKTTGVSLEGMFQEVPFNFFDVKEKDEEFVYPGAGETEDEFIGRCMGDTKMVVEFPDEKQRAAVCYSYYTEKMNFPDGTCWSGYEPYGTKIVDGREVPNCVPVKASIDTTGMKPYQTPNGDDLLKKKEMGMIGYDGGVPIYADEYEARAAATALGCSGAHQMDGAWAPCDNHEDAVKGVEATDLVVNKLKKMLELLGGKPL
jgi:hypothetical protein